MDLREVKVFVVDDNETFREGVIFYLENILSVKIIGSACNGKEFLENNQIGHADIILMDIEMPYINGIDAIKQFIWIYTHGKVIAVTNYEDKAYLAELIGAGFKGCVFKKNIYDELETAIKTVLDNKIFYPRNMKLL